MNYIILDMEWNQSYPGNKVYISDTRKQLSGEIIQIGAVKLDSDFNVVDSYAALVKPIFYRKLHFKVKELTGITQQQLSESKTFCEIFPEFISWCGQEHTFLIWGSDDIAILQQNIEINKYTDYKIHQWCNLQLIYNSQIGGEFKQISLSTACEVLGIPQDLQLHDALNDAIYTADVCEKLDMKKGLSEIPVNSGELQKSYKRKFRYYDFGSAKETLEFTRVSDNFCPVCDKPLTLVSDYHRKYYNQFVAIRECEEHGKFIENIVVSKINENAINSKYKSSKTLSRAKNDEHAELTLKTRKRRRSRKKSIPTQK